MSDETQTDQPHKGLKKGLYLFPTLFTAANIGMGFLAVMASIRGFHASFIDPNLAAGYFNMAAIGIGLAILFDTIDGRVARATKTATEIGVQFDSLADVLTFGIAPAALIYAWGFAGVFNENTSGHNIGVFLLFMYLMCGAFRLARFNVQSMRPRVLAEGSQKLDKKYFVGLPIPPAGGLLAAIVHFSPLPLSTFGENAARSYGYAMMALIAVLGIMMVSRIRYASFKSAGKGRAGIMLIIVLAAGATAVFLYSQYALILLASLYVGHGIVWFFLRRIPFGQRPAAASDI
ncbi:MAG: CDP-alcohol phosphatidyltransferase family protein [Acidobacteria bacterium]|nr:CDP-alcohol phosphatidyltransferase family protein [Acidobacteriota bacterium]MCW5949246.1 CDP-alcohol phosphatidyltransferase family protein [Pyrinomonadaceae bacterium]